MMKLQKKLDISANTVKKHMANTLAFLKARLDINLTINLLFAYLFLY